MSCGNRHTQQPRCDDCGNYGEWNDAAQKDLCVSCAESYQPEEETSDETDD